MDQVDSLYNNVIALPVSRPGNGRSINDNKLSCATKGFVPAFPGALCTISELKELRQIFQILGDDREKRRFSQV